VSTFAAVLDSGNPTAAPAATAKRRLTPPAYLPRAPRVFADLDVPESMLADLALRHVGMRGTATIQLLAKWMRLPLELAENLFRRLNEQNLFDVRKMTGDDYVFTLSGSGRKFAQERSISTRYVGPAPVSLTSWTNAVRAQAVPGEITREKLRQAFHDIVIEDKVLDELGPAMISQNAIFLYGPSGTGKTTVAERLMRVYDDTVVVPWAIEVEGQIIAIADPTVHEPVEFDEELAVEVDPRWVICRRPFVAVGGELVTSMLDLQRDESEGCCTAPLQMKASNGMLLIDDFGRQMISPRDLLNRWIVPLDRRIDFLSFGSGAKKFDIPFELQIVFSTNLAPNELADEAFLRRIPNKILIDAITAEQFDQIFRLVAAKEKIGYDAGCEQVLRELCLRHSPDLRPCYPRDIITMIRAIAVYEGRKLHIRTPDIERAVTGYFV